MQSKAAPPNRLLECISSSRNSCLQSLNSPLPEHFKFPVLITWRKPPFTRRNCALSIARTTTSIWKPTPAQCKHATFDIFFSFLHFLVTALNSAHFCNTWKFISLVLISRLQNPKKLLKYILTTHHSLPKKNKCDTVLQTENSLQFLEPQRIYRCPNKYNLLLSQ